MYLHGVQFTIFTDHHNLQNFATKALLNCRQARWAGLLAHYQFHIQFRPAKANGKADALTRRSGDLPFEGDGGGRPTQSILDPTQFLNFPPVTDHEKGAKPEPEPGPEPVPTPIPSTMFINSAILCNSVIKHNPNIRTALNNDKLANEIVNALRDGSKTLPKNSAKVPLGECTIDSTGLLFFYGLLYVPDDGNLYREVIHAYHDHPAAGHPARAATYELVSHNYWWPGML